MPTEPNDLEARVAALEYQVRAVAGDAAAARVLAGAADRDVSAMQGELNANRRVLNTLRETQVEHTAKLDTLETKFDNLTGVVTQNTVTLAEHGARLDGLEAKMDDGFAKMDDRFAKMDDRFATIEDRFATVISLIERQQPG